MPKDYFAEEIGGNSQPDYFAQEVIPQQVMPRNSNPILPNQDAVNTMISQRPSAFQTLNQELNYNPNPLEHPIDFMMKPLVTGMKALNVPVSMAESGLANFGLNLQQGNAPSPLGMVSPLLDKSFLQGVTQQKPAQFGDIMRTTGWGGNWNEILSRTTGLLANLGMVNTATKGLALNVAKKSQQLAAEHLPQKMDTQWLVKKANTLDSIANDAKGAIDNEYAQLLKTPTVNGVSVGDVSTNYSKFSGLLNDIELDNPELAKDITEKIGNNPANNINTARKISSLINEDYLPNVWQKVKAGIDPTKEQNQLTKYVKQLKQMQHDALKGLPEGEQLIDLDKRGSEVYDLTRVIKKMVRDKTNRPNNPNVLRSTFTGNGNPDNMQYIQRLKELNGKTSQFLKDMNKYHGRIATKQMIGYEARRTLPWIVGGSIAIPLARHLFSNAGGDTGD